MPAQYSIPTMSLKELQLQPVAFNALQYTPEIADINILNRSMEKQEARSKESRERITAIDSALADYRTKLHESEIEEFDKYAENIRNEIKEQIDLGNTESAIRFAMESADNIISDRDLQNKIIVNQKYQTKLKEIEGRNDLDVLTKRMWKKYNQYSYNGTPDWKETESVVSDIDIQQFQNIIANMTAEDVSSVSSSVSSSNPLLWDANKTPVNNLKDAEVIAAQVSSTRGGGTTRRVKSAKDMAKTAAAAMQNPNIAQGFLQKFRATYSALEDAEAQMNDMSLPAHVREKAAADYEQYKRLLTDKNGIILVPTTDNSNFYTWFDTHVIPMFENMEYNNVSTDSRIDDTFTPHLGSSSYGGSGSKTTTTGVNQYGIWAPMFTGNKVYQVNKGAHIYKPNFNIADVTSLF